MDLRATIYSEEFRNFISHITGCGPLSDKTDLAANIHTQGCHLLTHDDVIGDRAVSFIIYLTDPESEWTEADGGALELYPLKDTYSKTNIMENIPKSIPSKC